ncbi:MAG: hypothetical protein ACLQFT_03830 [Steroidobacteraceae bacterium]|jgi:hypothetical protein
MGKSGDAIKVLTAAGPVAAPTFADMIDRCRNIDDTVCPLVAPEEHHDHQRDPGASPNARGQITLVNSGATIGPPGLMPPPANMTMTGFAPEMRIDNFDDTGMSRSTPLPLLPASKPELPDRTG